MSERPTRHELAYLRACSAIDGIQHACKKPEGFDFDDVVTRLIDAYEATQRPVEPSAHRSEQAAHPADPLEGRRPWLEVGHNGDEPEAPPADEHDAPPLRRATDTASPTNDVGARVTPPWTHRQALDALRALREACCDNDWAIKDLEHYVSERAELERRARELAMKRAAYANTRPDLAGARHNALRELLTAIDALAELLGTEES